MGLVELSFQRESIAEVLNPVYEFIHGVNCVMVLAVQTRNLHPHFSHFNVFYYVERLRTLSNIAKNFVLPENLNWRFHELGARGHGIE